MISHNPQETIEYAREFAKTLEGGEVIGLIGDLGAGKTTFVKGVAEELKVAETITSPTFVILKVYNLQPKGHTGGGLYMVRKFVHIDAYRVESVDDIKSVGIEDYLNRKDVIVVIEWAEKIRGILPKSTIYIDFSHKSESTREILVHE